MSKKEKRAAMVVAVVLIVFAVTSFVKAACVEYTTVEVVVQEGDSLWSIWEEVGHGRFDKWKYEVMEMNDMEKPDLMAYQKLMVPVVNE